MKCQVCKTAEAQVITRSSAHCGDCLRKELKMEGYNPQKEFTKAVNYFKKWSKK